MTGFAATLACSACLVAVESIGITFLTIWSKNNSVLAWICAMYSFVALAALLGWTIRFVGNMNTVNVLWQSMSIVSLCVISVWGFREAVTWTQILGSLMAIGSAMCFGM